MKIDEMRIDSRSEPKVVTEAQLSDCVEALMLRGLFPFACLLLTFANCAPQVRNSWSLIAMALMVIITVIVYAKTT